ncbi:hypothetical protein [Vibrio harveyi]|uniref:hypothetical protein n=1 Tax=Vibrio harveyi TaxID=669 RepID=UPI003CE677F2
MQIVNGNVQVSAPITFKGLNCEFEDFLNQASDLFNEHVKIQNYIVKDHLCLSEMKPELSSLTDWTLVEEGTIEDGYQIEVNAIFNVSLDKLKVKDESLQSVNSKVKELLNHHMYVSDRTYSPLIDVGEVSGIENIDCSFECDSSYEQDLSY